MSCFFLNHKCVEESPWLTTSRVWCPYPDSCSGASSFLCCSLLQYQQCNWKQSCSRKSHESQKSQSTLCIFTTTCVLLLSIPIRKNTFWSVGAGDTSWAMPIYLLISKVKVKFYKQDINSVFMFAAQSLIQQHSNMKWHCPELYWLFIQCAFRNASCSKLFISLSATGWASLDKAITHPVRGFSDFGISSWKCWNKFWILKRLWYVRLKHVVPLSFRRRDRLPTPVFLGFPGGWDSEESACNVGDVVQSLGWEDPLEESMATHSSTRAWRIPMDRGAWWVARVGYDWVTKNSTAQHLANHRNDGWNLQIDFAVFLFPFVPLCCFLTLLSWHFPPWCILSQT